MSREQAEVALTLAKRLHGDVPRRTTPSAEGSTADSEQLLPSSLYGDTRGYIEKLCNQINGCYEKGWFDGCAVLIRRLVETLLIECFENHNISDRVKDSNGDYKSLDTLIGEAEKVSDWNLTRNVKRALPALKDLGDQSAHSRYFNAHRHDVDKVSNGLRVTTEELLYIAELID